MPPLIATAPGKVVLCGEYAVLGSAPAVCMAVNRRAVVKAAAHAGDSHVVRSPGLQHGRWRFRQGRHNLEWLDPQPAPATFALLEQLWSRLPPPSTECYSLTLDSSATVDERSGQKLGLGASAAIAVALAALLSRLAGVEDLPEFAAVAHRKAQGGRGSGVDVATSRHGGIIAYRRQDPYRPTRLGWPAGLHCAFLWSGTPASTADQLSLVGDAGDSVSSAINIGALEREARDVAAAWQTGAADTVIAALRRYVPALRSFDAEFELGVFAAGHGRLTDDAAAMGVVYKPCGAGGGDIGAAFATDAAAIDEFRSHARKRGFEPLDLSPDDSGVTTMNTAAP